jgi:hypothetical protein
MITDKSDSAGVVEETEVDSMLEKPGAGNGDETSAVVESGKQRCHTRLKMMRFVETML